MASLLCLYLEPNLRADSEASINLSNLVDVKDNLQKPYKELNGQSLTNRRKMDVKVEKGLYDWQLSAHLKGYAIKLPGEKQPGN
ncbi:MAG: hypothetical protein PF545_06790 [Elusimicrobia bacterium]|jgi:hypothetical protein|nr:hypothetical protein [Elusimicrobiota bacterium]